MKKKLLICCMITATAFLIGIVILHFSGKKPKDGTLFIEDRLVSAENVQVGKQHAIIPFLPVMKELGADIMWYDSMSAEITYQEESYILNLEDFSLCKKDTEINLIRMVPGTANAYRRAIEKDLLLDDETLQFTLYRLEKTKTFYRVRVDYDAASVFLLPHAEQK